MTAAEARAAADCFGPDDCYGVTWTLPHLVETGPNPRVVNVGLVTDEPVG
ncbi:hypothetical protein [Streptomyces sp. SD31]